jgi:hypothetical protein
LECIDNTPVIWGPGVSYNSENRPTAPCELQDKYGKFSTYFIAENSPKIYLTFDEGYENGYTAELSKLTPEDKLQKKILSIQQNMAGNCAGFAAMAWNRDTWEHQIEMRERQLAQSSDILCRLPDDKLPECLPLLIPPCIFHGFPCPCCNDFHSLTHGRITVVVLKLVGHIRLIRQPLFAFDDDICHQNPPLTYSFRVMDCADPVKWTLKPFASLS